MLYRAGAFRMTRLHRGHHDELGCTPSVPEMRALVGGSLVQIPILLLCFRSTWPSCSLGNFSSRPFRAHGFFEGTLPMRWLSFHLFEGLIRLWLMHDSTRVEFNC